MKNQENMRKGLNFALLRGVNRFFLIFQFEIGVLSLKTWALCSSVCIKC